MIFPGIIKCTWSSIIHQQKLHLWFISANLYLIFCNRNSILPRLCVWQMRLANMQGSISYRNMCIGFSGAPQLRSYASQSCCFATVLQAISHILTKVLSITYTLCIAKSSLQIWCTGYVVTRYKTCADDFPVQLNVDLLSANAAALAPLHEPVPHFLTQIPNLAYRLIIAYYEWQIFSARSMLTRLQTYTEDSLVLLTVVELCIFCSCDMEMYICSGVYNEFQICNRRMIWSLMLNDSQYATPTIYHVIGNLGTLNVAYCFH